MIRIITFILLTAVCVNLFGNQQIDADQQDKSVLEAGLQYLMQLQSKDGAWHSRHYGSLKQGAALTTLVLYSASHLSEETREPFKRQIDAGFEFLQAGIERSNFVTNPEGSEDYPVYCTAMLLVASERMDLPLSDQAKTGMVKYLIESQVAQSRGFVEDHVEFGGWDVLGPDTQLGKTSGTNVSVTCHVLEALAGFKDDVEVHAALEKAELWMQRMGSQATDGGFSFAPKSDSPNNKAGWSDEENRQPRSYGTATCDGLRILNYLGETQGSTPFDDAVNWLVKAESFSRVPGFEEESSWPASLKFYYFSGLAKNFSILPDQVVREAKECLARELEELQGNDGRWQNQAALMREDDPIIATSFAIMTLGLIQND